MSNQQTIAASEALPKKKLDLMPLLLVPIMALLAYPVVHDLPTWATLTVAGIGMGLILFLVASGFTLVFGLMDVLNFGHGIFVTLGAYFGASLLGNSLLMNMGGSLTAPLAAWYTADDLFLNMLALFCAAGFGMLVTAIIGFIFERLIIRPVYGSHLTQILVTSGGMIVAEQLILALWGAEAQPLMKPASLNGAILFGEMAIEKYRLMTMTVGLIVFAVMMLLLNRTKLGLLIRAGVQDREMVEALGYKVKFLFVSVFAAGAALAALGGLFWGMYMDATTSSLGGSMMVMIFIITIIGGMGSIGGAFIGAILLGLLTNYTGFAYPIMAAFSSIILMCLVILWRPNGLYPVSKR